MVPHTLWRDRTLRPDLGTWCALCELARSRGATSATDEAIGRELGISARTVQDSLGRLERAGWIGRERDESGGRRITLHPEAGGPVELRVIG